MKGQCEYYTGMNQNRCWCWCSQYCSVMLMFCDVSVMFSIMLSCSTTLLDVLYNVLQWSVMFYKCPSIFCNVCDVLQCFVLQWFVMLDVMFCNGLWCSLQWSVMFSAMVCDVLSKVLWWSVMYCYVLWLNAMFCYIHWCFTMSKKIDLFSLESIKCWILHSE